MTYIPGLRILDVLPVPAGTHMYLDLYCGNVYATVLTNLHATNTKWTKNLRTILFDIGLGNGGRWQRHRRRTTLGPGGSLASLQMVVVSHRRTMPGPSIVMASVLAGVVVVVRGGEGRWCRSSSW